MNRRTIITSALIACMAGLLSSCATIVSGGYETENENNPYGHESIKDYRGSLIQRIIVPVPAILCVFHSTKRRVSEEKLTPIL